MEPADRQRDSTARYTCDKGGTTDGGIVVEGSQVIASDERLNSVLGKCFAMLEAINTSATSSLTLAELSRASGVPKASAHRLVTKLVDSGLLDKVGERYAAGIRLFEFAHNSPHLRRLREAALPHLADLHAMTREIVHFAIPVGNEVLYLEKLAGSRSPNLPSSVGHRMPSHCTGLGKAMLAFSTVDRLRDVFSEPLTPRTKHTIVVPTVLARELSEVRSKHVAYERDEAVLGMSCVAAPVLDPDDRAIAAISITVPTYRFRAESMKKHLLATADRLAEELVPVPA